MPAKMNIKVPRRLQPCISKYNWWWRNLDATLGAMTEDQTPTIMNGKSHIPVFNVEFFWAYLCESAYLYELNKRFKGTYHFEKAWPDLTLTEKTDLVTGLNRELEPGRIFNLQTIYNELSMSFASLLIGSRHDPGNEDADPAWESQASDVQDELASRIYKLAQTSQSLPKGNWSSPDLCVYNLNKSNATLVALFKDWLLLERRMKRATGAAP